MGLKIRKMLILWGFTKKNNIYEELPKNGGGGGGSLRNFVGDLVKNREGVFEGALIPRCALT